MAFCNCNIISSGLTTTVEATVEVNIDSTNVITDFVVPDGASITSGVPTLGTYDVGTQKWTIPSLPGKTPESIKLTVSIDDEPVFSGTSQEITGTTQTLTGEVNITNNIKTYSIGGITCSDIAKCFIETTGTFQESGLIYGGVVWDSGLTFDVTETKFVVGGEIYINDPDTITLSAADPSDARIDVIVADIDGTIKVVEGTPSTDPAKPEIDLENQVEVSFVTINAGATVPAGVSATAIYLENAGSPTEWDGVENTGGARLSLSSGIDPFQGSINIEATAAVRDDQLTFTTPTPVSINDLDVLEMHLKSKATWETTNLKLRIAWELGGTRVSNWITLQDGAPYGFDSSDTVNYQTIGIPNDDFVFDEATVDGLRIKVDGGGGGSIGFYLDQIRYQDGIVDSVDIPDDTNIYTISGVIEEDRFVAVNDSELKWEGTGTTSTVLWTGFNTATFTKDTNTLVFDETGLDQTSTASGVGLTLTASDFPSVNLVESTGGDGFISFLNGIGSEMVLQVTGANNPIRFKDIANAIKFQIDTSTGQLTANDYGSGTFAGVDAYVASFSVSGAIQEMDAADLATFLGTSTQNIYTVDGSIADPLRTVTVGANQLYFTGSNTTNVVEIEGTGTGSFPVLQITGGDSFGLKIDTVSSGRSGLIVNGNGAAAVLTSNPVTTTGSYSPLTLIRTTQGTAGNDIANRINFQLENSVGSSPSFGAIDIVGTDVTSGAEVAAFDVTLQDGVGFNRYMRVAGADGSLLLDAYTGAVTGTIDTAAVFTSTGKVIQTDASGFGTWLGSATQNIYTADGTIAATRTVTVDGAKRLVFSGTTTNNTIQVTGTSATSPTMFVTNSGGNRAIDASSSGTAGTIRGSSSGSGAGVTAINTAGTFALSVDTTSAVTTGDIVVAQMIGRTSGTALDNLGTRVDFYVENDAGSAQFAGNTTFALSDVSAGVETGTFTLDLVRTATSTPVFSINGANGQATLLDYGSGAITGTATSIAAFDTNGNIIEEPITGLDNIYNADGTLTGDRIVTAGASDLDFDFTNGQFRIDQTGDVGAGQHFMQIRGSATATGPTLRLESQSTVTALNVVANSSNFPVSILKDTTSTGGVDTLLLLTRRTTGTAVNGIGAGIRVDIENDAGTTSQISGINFRLSNVASGSEQSAIDFINNISSSSQTVFTIDGNNIRAHGYGLASITGTATSIAAFDTNGNIIEEPISGLDNIYTADGTLTGDRIVTIDAAKTLTFNGTTTDDVVIINQAVSNTNQALRVIGQGNGTEGSAAYFEGDPTSNMAVKILSTGNGRALEVEGSGKAFDTISNTTSTGSIFAVAGLQRRTTGTAVNGIGAGLDFMVEDGGGGVSSTGRIANVLTDVTAGDEKSDFEWYLQEGLGAFLRKMKLDGPTGQLTLDGYDGSTITGTPAAGLFVESTGGVVEESVSESHFFTKEIHIPIFGSGTAVTTGDGTNGYVVPASMNGYNITNVVAANHSPGSGGTIDVQIRRRRAGADVDVLSTPVTIATTEQFAQDGTINAANDDVQTGDILYADVDSTQTGSPNGLDAVIELSPA